MEAGPIFFLVSTYRISLLFIAFPLHFIAKVKVIIVSAIKRTCECQHITILLFSGYKSNKKV